MIAINPAGIAVTPQRETTVTYATPILFSSLTPPINPQ
jgi:hypothetical protein